MQWFTYDTEVYAYDFIAVFKDKATKMYYVFHNDNEGIANFMEEHSNAVFCGFNTKDYDQYIIKGIVGGLSPESIKAVNDYLVLNDDNAGWQCPLLQGIYYKFNNVDIRNDVRLGISLKEIEGHLGLPIVETEVSFNVDRPLTREELDQVIYYCKKDVDATEKFTEIRHDYLDTKSALAERASIENIIALAITNAKLTAKMLRAKRVERTDGRDYVYPPNLDLSLIPRKILDFFETIHDKTIPDKTLFATSLSIIIGGMKCKYAWGGVHGSLESYYEESTETRVIQNRDVSSLYPSLIELYNYLSRNVPDPQLFYDIRRDRITAKRNGDKRTAKALKLPLNTVSGAQENEYNDLYDPLPTRSLRISGQLFLTMLAMMLLNECHTIKLLNFNTDGLMYSVDKSELSKVDHICAKWEQITKFELETDNIDRVWIKDVNNLLFVDVHGEVKTVGGYLNYGISVKGAWAINNNHTIVKKAVVAYFVHGTPVEETINNSEDIFEFQIIAKAGSKYSSAYQLVDGEKITTQKVNRVYATSDSRYGTIYKVKAATDAVAKIAGLPTHCLIDNNNELSIDSVDRTWYIKLAKKYINDYLGIRPPRKNTRRINSIAKQMLKVLDNI